MNILYTLPDLHFGGASNLLLQSLTAVSNRNKVFLVYFAPNKSLQKKFEDVGIEPVQIKYTGIASLPRTISNIRKFISDHDIQIVHCNLILDKALMALATLGLKVKLVGALHSAGKQTGKVLKKHVMKNAFESFLHRRIFHYSIAVSEASKRYWVQSNGLKKERVFVITNGIKKLPHMSNVPDDVRDFVSRFSIVIGTACRFHFIKGLPRLVRVFGIAKSELPNIGLMLIGDGGHRQAVEREIERLQLQESVHITGFTEQVAAYLSQLHYYVNASFTEAMPISIIEAMSLGIPVIGSNVGGIPEIVKDGANGYLVDFENEQQAAAHITGIMHRHQQDFARLKENAFQTYVTQFSDETYASKLQMFYASLLN